jgi:hypothetical protein
MLKRAFFLTTLLFLPEAWADAPIDALYYPGNSIHWMSRPGVLEDKPLFPGKEQQLVSEELGAKWGQVRKLKFENQAAFERARREAETGGGLLEINAQATSQAHPEQWGLSNTGQAQEIEISDVQVLPLASTPGEDIGLRGLPAENPGNRIKVAVLDSGLDLEHPAFARTLHKTASECEAISQYRQCMNTVADKEQCHRKYAQLDTDGNGYPLDCSGWSISGSVDRRTGIAGKNDPSDEDGHGTHVSGIIAAEGFVSGVLQSVALIPVKVMGRESLGSGLSETLPDPRSREFTESVTFADYLARGMLYAIRSGAQVINMSLGYSAVNDSAIMKRMTQLALSKGIIVVAAAGNQSSRSPVFPCTYLGVICVASHSSDGSISFFSNFGDGTDLAAPGHSILSTWFRRSFPSRFTERRGFDFKNGTSQASPFVAGAAARLLNLGLPPREVVARLLATGRPHRPPTAMPDPVEKKTLGGNLDLSRAWSSSRKLWIAPTLKGPLFLKWEATLQGAATHAKLRLPLKNIWAAAEGTVRILLGSPNSRDGNASSLRFSQTEFVFSGWAEDEEKTIEVEAHWNATSDLSGEYVLPIRIESAFGTQELFKSLEFFVPVSPFDASMIPAQGVTVIPHEVSDVSSLPAMSFKPMGTDGALLGLYTERNILRLTAWAREPHRYRKLQTVSLSTPTERLLSVTRKDFDGDGRVETAVATADTSSKKFRLRYLDSEFVEIPGLGAEFSTDVVVPPRELTWFRERGRLIPYFVAPGHIPTQDEPPYDPWRALTARAAQPKLRLYKILPAEWNQGSLRLVVPVSRERELPVMQLVTDPATGVAWAIVFNGSGYSGQFQMVPLEETGLATARSVGLDLETYGLLPSLPLWRSPESWPVFWTPSTEGRLRLFSLRPEQDGTFMARSHLLPSIRPGDAARELIWLNTRLDESISGFYRSRYFLHFFDSRSPGVQIADTRMHEANTVHAPARVAGEPALVLPERAGAPLTTEVLVPSAGSQGELTRPARFKTLGVRGCEITDLVPSEGGPVRKLRYFCGTHFVEFDL